MSDSAQHLDLLSASQVQKEVTANNLFDAMSPAALFGRRAIQTTGLTWAMYGGRMMVNGTSTAIANTGVSLTNNATNYVEVEPSTGVVSANTSGFTDGRIKLYTVITSGGVVTDYTDYRTPDVAGLPYPRKKSPAYSASITIDWRNGDLFDIGTLTGNISIAFSNAYDGQQIVVRTRQDATGNRIVTFTHASYGTDLTTVNTAASTGADKYDEWTFRYHAASGQYRVVACVRGF